jgi:polyvinyl alcohol dehydrogenase (cytochrome)
MWRDFIAVIAGVVALPLAVHAQRAYATSDAKLLWEVDTARDYPTVNGVSTRGGAMDGPGPTIVDGMLYVNSGYGQWGGLPGNVLLAFEVAKR